MEYTHKTQWLQDAQLGQLQVLMVRYALRAFPAICPKSGGRPFDEQFFLRHARSLIAACCFLADRSEETHAAAAFAAFAAGDFTRNKLQTAASIAAEAASKSLVLGDEGEARDTILNAIELLPLTDFFEQAKWDLEQLQRKPVRSPISPSPLWTVPLLHFSADQQIPLPNDHELKSRLSFWLEWYQGFLDGKLVDWELQRRVALIDDAIWDAGPEAVAAEIERIKAEWLAEQIPQADQVSFDSTTGLFFSQQVPLNAVTLVETTLKQVEFARSVAAKSNCGFNSNSTAWIYIGFTLDSCRDDANAIEQNLEIARHDIIEGLKDGTYQPDAKLTALEQVLDRAVTDLRAHHPDVAEAWEVRINHKLKLAKADQKQLIVEKATELIAVSQEKLGAEFQLDAKTISETSGEVQSGAIRRFFGRVAQMRIVVRSSEVVKRIDASSGYKGTRIVQTLQSLIDLIIGAWPG